MKATQATPTKLSRRSRSGRWEDALLFVDEEGDGEEGLSPAPEGAAICCRVFMLLSPEVGAAAGQRRGINTHARSWALAMWEEVCGKVGEGEGQSSEGEVWCGATEPYAAAQTRRAKAKGEAHTFESWRLWCMRQDGTASVHRCLLLAPTRSSSSMLVRHVGRGVVVRASQPCLLCEPMPQFPTSLAVVARCRAVARRASNDEPSCPEHGEVLASAAKNQKGKIHLPYCTPTEDNNAQKRQRQSETYI